MHLTFIPKISPLVITAVAGNLVSFSAGTIISWSSPEMQKLKNSIMHVSDYQASWITSIFLLGSAIGPILFGFLADKMGRRPSLLLMGFPLAIGFLVMAFVRIVEVFYFTRLLMGLSVGGVHAVMPMYIGEIAHSSNRGTLGGLINTFVSLGILFSYIVGPYLSIVTFNLILAIFPSLFIPIFFFFSLESPRYLISKQKSNEGRVVLRKLRGQTFDVDSEIADIEAATKNEAETGLKDLFRNKGNVKAFCIVIPLFTFQQFSGIAPVFAYAETIFTETGGSVSPTVCAMIIGAILFISSFISNTLSDRLGRKVLLLVSGIGMMISEGILGAYSYLKDHDANVENISFIPIVSLVVYVLAYNIGLGSVPWTLVGEIYSTNVRALASAVSAIYVALVSFFIVYFFQSVIDSIGLGPCFLMFAGFCALSVIFTRLVVFETKGKSLEEIETYLNK